MLVIKKHQKLLVCLRCSNPVEDDIHGRLDEDGCDSVKQGNGLGARLLESDL